MVIGRFLRVLAALALMLAPSAALAGEGAARPMADHASAPSEAGHCTSTPDDGAGGEAADKGCCAAGCAGVAFPSPALLPLPAPPPVAGARGLAASLDGLPGELATPPPRRA